MNPPPPWYSAPSLNAPRMRRVASSCSYVNCIPRWFAPPQPKQELVGLGVSSMFGISVSVRAFRDKRNCRSLAPLGMTASRQLQNHKQEATAQSKHKPKAKEPAGGQRHKNRDQGHALNQSYTLDQGHARDRFAASAAL